MQVLTTFGRVDADLVRCAAEAEQRLREDAVKNTILHFGTFHLQTFIKARKLIIFGTPRITSGLVVDAKVSCSPKLDVAVESGLLHLANKLELPSKTICSILFVNSRLTFSNGHCWPR